jgi:thioredoxin reductase (NADPH)
LDWRDNLNGRIETHPINVFVMTGATRTAWLARVRGARRQGVHPDGSRSVAGRSARAGRWRRRYLLETSLPSAVGDVRGGNIKRVASAVGEGSIAVSFVHQVLHE